MLSGKQATEVYDSLHRIARHHESSRAGSWASDLASNLFCYIYQTKDQIPPSAVLRTAYRRRYLNHVTRQRTIFFADLQECHDTATDNINSTVDHLVAQTRAISVQDSAPGYACDTEEKEDAIKRLEIVMKVAAEQLPPSQQRAIEERLISGQGDRPQHWKGADDVAFCKAAKKLRALLPDFVVDHAS